MKKKNGLISQIRDELMTFFENVIAPYMDKEFGQVNGRLDKVENRLDKVENRLENVENRLDKVENRLENVENRLENVENRLENVENEVMYVKNDVRDLKADTPTQTEVNNHDKRLKKLEKLHQKQLPAFI